MDAKTLNFPRIPLKTAADSTEEHCATCRFYFLLVAHDHAGRSVQVPLCRRYPPTMAFTMQPVPLPAGMLPKRGEPLPMQPATVPLFPEVNPDSWCGEFAPAPAREP